MHAALARYEHTGFEVMLYTEGDEVVLGETGGAELHPLVKDDHDPATTAATGGAPAQPEASPPAAGPAGRHARWNIEPVRAGTVEHRAGWMTAMRVACTEVVVEECQGRGPELMTYRRGEDPWRPKLLAVTEISSSLDIYQRADMTWP